MKTWKVKYIARVGENWRPQTFYGTEQQCRDMAEKLKQRGCKDIKISEGIGPLKPYKKTKLIKGGTGS